MNKKYIVDLTEQERNRLRELARSGKDSARRICWAQALLKADVGWTDQKISEALDIGIRTVQRIRQRFVEEGIEVALGARSRLGRGRHGIGACALRSGRGAGRTAGRRGIRHGASRRRKGYGRWCR